MDKVHKLMDQSDAVLSKLEAMKGDKRVHAALTTLTSETMEQKVMEGLETIDAERLIEDAELALTDKHARNKQPTSNNQ